MYLLATLSVAYLTRVLLFDAHGTGPFPSAESKIVVDEGPVRAVHLFDRVRRVLGAYEIVDSLWFVRSKRMEVWECPKCLSFWMAFVGAVPVIMLVALDYGALALVVYPFIHLSMAFCSSFLVFKHLEIESHV